MSAINNLIVKIGRSVGGVVGTLYQAGRDAVDTTIRNVIPFMAFISFIIGLILTTGVGDWIAKGLKGSASTLPGLLLISVVCAIPLISPLLGPGAVIHRSLEHFLVLRLVRETSLLSTHFQRCLLSTHRLVATLSL